MEEKAILSNASFEGKQAFKLPPGAEMLQKSMNVSVREIENGFVVRKSYDIKYMMGDESKYDYYSKEWFSKVNPLTITLDEKETPLEDKLD